LRHLQKVTCGDSPSYYRGKIKREERGNEEALPAIWLAGFLFSMGNISLSGEIGSAFVYDLDGKCPFYGTNPKMGGKDLLGLTNPDGKQFIADRVEFAKAKTREGL
jgi:hypothetical protein